MTINLIDARRGLHNKCIELFADKKIAEQIYRYLCDGIEDCEEAKPKYGRWVENWGGKYSCSVCGGIPPFNSKGGDLLTDYCPNCGADMREDSDIDENWYSDEYRRIGEDERDEVENG